MSNLSERAYAAQLDLYAVEDSISDALLDAEVALEFAEYGFDEFDRSISIMGAEDSVKLNEKFLNNMWDQGFKSVHVLYESGDTENFQAPDAEDIQASPECPVSGECCV